MSKLDFESTVELVRQMLSEEEFGIISEVDVAENIRGALKIDHRPYMILGACIPALAHRGLTARPDLGVLLPCNVCIHVEGDEVIVSAMEPREVMAMLDDEVINELANDVGLRLERLIAAIPARSVPHLPIQEGGGRFSEGSWPAALQQVIDKFNEITDSMERFELLYSWANECELLPVEKWCEATRVHGCQSEAHVHCRLDEQGGFQMLGSADSQLVQGLIAIAQRAVNGLDADEVGVFPISFLSELGLQDSLTPNRANGFLNMFTKVRHEALSMISSDS